jgi:hypothetical protein
MLLQKSNLEEEMRDQITLIVQSIAYEFSLIQQTPSFDFASKNWLANLDTATYSPMGYERRQQQMTRVLRENGIDPQRFVEASKEVGLPLSYCEEAHCLYGPGFGYGTDKIMRVLRQAVKKNIEEGS